MKFKSINPYTEEVNWTYDSLPIGECRTQIEKSRPAFLSCSLSAERRAKQLNKVAEVLRQNNDIYAEIITTEMGKPIRQSKGEIQKCSRFCDYYAENAAELLKDEAVSIGLKKSYITFEPPGVILGIMTWNFPFWQVFRFPCQLCVQEMFVYSNMPQTFQNQLSKLRISFWKPDFGKIFSKLF